MADGAPGMDLQRDAWKSVQPGGYPAQLKVTLLQRMSVRMGKSDSFRTGQLHMPALEQLLGRLGCSWGQLQATAQQLQCLAHVDHSAQDIQHPQAPDEQGGDPTTRASDDKAEEKKRLLAQAIKDSLRVQSFEATQREAAQHWTSHPFQHHNTHAWGGPLLMQPDSGAAIPGGTELMHTDSTDALLIDAEALDDEALLNEAIALPPHMFSPEPAAAAPAEDLCGLEPLPLWAAGPLSSSPLIEDDGDELLSCIDQSLRERMEPAGGGLVDLHNSRGSSGHSVQQGVSWDTNAFAPSAGGAPVPCISGGGQPAQDTMLWGADHARHNGSDVDSPGDPWANSGGTSMPGIAVGSCLAMPLVAAVIDCVVQGNHHYAPPSSSGSGAHPLGGGYTSSTSATHSADWGGGSWMEQQQQQPVFQPAAEPVNSGGWGAFGGELSGNNGSWQQNGWNGSSQPAASEQSNLWGTQETSWSSGSGLGLGLSLGSSLGSGLSTSPDTAPNGQPNAQNPYYPQANEQYSEQLQHPQHHNDYSNLSREQLIEMLQVNSHN